MIASRLPAGEDTIESRRARAQRWFADGDARRVSTSFDERETSWMRRLSLSLLLARARKTYGGPPHTFLDIGCGDGAVLAEVERRHPHVSLVGTDPVQEAVESARRRVPNARIERAAGAPSGVYDAVFAHLSLGLWTDPDRELARAMRALSPRGMLYVVDIASEDEDRALSSAREDDERAYLTAQYAAALTFDAFRGVMIDAADRAGQGDIRVVVGTGLLGGFALGSREHMALMDGPEVGEALAAMAREPTWSGIQGGPPALLHGWAWRETRLA